MNRYINADLTDTEILNAVQKETADADTFITVRRILNKLPTVDVAPVVHAKWIKIRYKMYTCSRCKRSVYLEGLNVTDENETKLLRELYPYCNCGAKMDEE